MGHLVAGLVHQHAWLEGAFKGKFAMFSARDEVLGRHRDFGGLD
jgi:hypothetical protein